MKAKSESGKASVAITLAYPINYECDVALNRKVAASCHVLRHDITRFMHNYACVYATCNATVRRAWVRLQCANLRAKAWIRSGYQSLPKLIHGKNEILQLQFAYLKIWLDTDLKIIQLNQ